MTIEFAQIISTSDQRPETTDPVPLVMDQNDSISGVTHSADHPTEIKFEESGTYVVIAAPQVGKLSGDTPSYIDFWFRRNGKDIPNSNVRATITTNNDKDVIVNQTMMTFDAGDVLNIVMAVSKAGGGLGIEAIQTEGRPLIPSIIFSMHKIKDSVEGHWISTQKGTKKIWIEN